MRLFFLSLALICSSAYAHSWMFLKSGGTACDLSTVTGIRLITQAKDLSLSDGQSVTNWPSTGPQTYAFAEATHPPIYKTGIINGKPVVRFDGINQKLTGTTNSSNIYSSAYTWFVVARPISISGDNVANPANADSFYNDVLVTDNFIGNGLVLRLTGPQLQALVYNGSAQNYSVSTIPAVGTAFIAGFRFDGSTISTQVDGGARVDTSFSGSLTGGGTPLVMAFNTNNPSIHNANAYSNYDISVLGISNQAVTNTEMSNVITCLNGEYHTF